jgi:hypothetical protein
MIMRRGLFAATLALVALSFGLESRAEIRVVTDRNGDYRETRILMPDMLAFGAGASNVWTPVGRVGKDATLNPTGADNRDLWPAIAESKGSANRAWAVWSRLDGLDYDLVWSRWTDDGWQRIEWLDEGTAGQGDDLDPYITFDINGRTYVAWWRAEGDFGRVYLSMFLVTQWMTAFPVSDFDVDSRYPSVEVLSDGTIFVKYETPEGTVVHTVVFDEPVTITDDIDPLDHLSSERVQYVEDATP